MSTRLAFLLRLALFLPAPALLACESEPPVFTAPAREPGDRTPLTRRCDDVDPTRCLLPWPSNAFAVADPDTETGLRLEVDMTSLNRRDDGSSLSRADGFSRMSTIVAGFPVRVDGASVAGEVHLFLAQHDHPDVGTEIPLRLETIVREHDTASVLVGHPLAPLAPAADHVVVVTDGLVDESGAPLVQDRITRVALGLEPARSEDEAALQGYHAATRAFLEERGIDPTRVLRAWDFTTRSEVDPRRRLLQMIDAAIAAVDAGEVEVEIDELQHRDEGAVATIVLGRLVGLPNFLVADGLSVDADGDPLAAGTRDAPFRAVLPRGEGNYPVLMYGHGTGGTVRDAAFDNAIAEAGAAKIGIEFYGWTETTVAETFLGLADIAKGSAVAASGLVQAVADASAIRHAVSGILGDVLSAGMLGGEVNPHAERRPDDSVPIWVGGSLGGTMGLVFTAANPAVEHAVLNVGGAGWATWVRDALPFGYIEGLIATRNGGDLSVPLVVAIAQTNLDEADGASWADVIAAEHPISVLLQESIGDPVLPNFGTEVAARVIGARMVGDAIVEIEGIESAESVAGGSAITQFRVTSDDALAIHGFAARNTPAAEAAQAQIFGFVRSAWDRAARIELPPGCGGGSCDFSAR